MPSNVLVRLVLRLLLWPTMLSMAPNCMLYRSMSLVMRSSNLVSSSLYSAMRLVKLLLCVAMVPVLANMAVIDLKAVPTAPEGAVL